MFPDFLDRVTELTKSFYTLVFALYREKMQIRTSPGKWHTQQSADGDQTRSSWPSSGRGTTVSPAVAALCDSVHRGRPAREARPPSLCPELLLELNHKLPECNLLSPASPGAQVNTFHFYFLWRSAWCGVAQSPLVNHVPGLSAVRGPRQTKMLLSAE